MAFKYVLEGADHEPARYVTNNHFDQDGLVSAHVLIEPDVSLAHRDLLADVARAGDFATYQFRAAARASMAIWAYAQPDRSPLGSALNVAYPEMCALLYEHTLPLLLPMALDPERFRDLWHDEDVSLTASEQAIASGAITIDEVAELDLAIVTIDADLAGGHRFASDTAELIHPMALHNATRCCRMLLIRGSEFRYEDRYETWVQYKSRGLQKRRDMAPLAAELTALETGTASWSATPPSRLTPNLGPDRPSSLAPEQVKKLLITHLTTSPPAWDPAAAD